LDLLKYKVTANMQYHYIIKFIIIEIK